MGVVAEFVTVGCQSSHYVSKLLMFTDPIHLASVGKTRESVTRGRHVADMQTTNMWVTCATCDFVTNR